MAKSRTRRVGARIARGARGQKARIKRDAIALAAGAAAPYSTQFLGDMGPGVTLAVAGIAGKDQALESVGMVSLGGALVRRFTAGTAMPAPSGNYL